MKPHTFTHEVEQAVSATVGNFIKTYKDCIRHSDELRSEAYYGFLVASQSFKQDKGTQFSTWLYSTMWNRMLRYRKRQYRFSIREEVTELDSMPERVRFDFEQFLSKLSEDAKTAVMLTINPTKKMMKEVNNSRQQMMTYKSCIYQELKKLGWTPTKIQQVFTEVHEVL